MKLLSIKNLIILLFGTLLLSTLTGCKISGRVLEDGVGIEGVTVKLGDRETLTNAQGYYQFGSIGAGTYQVTLVAGEGFYRDVAVTVHKSSLLKSVSGINISRHTNTLRLTSHGEMIGDLDVNGNHQWLGIGFAKPPVGERRWQAPQAPDSWEGRYLALNHGNPCTQISGFLSTLYLPDHGTVMGDEDCLYLNIYAPALTEVPGEGDQLPVMLWVHGGGNAIGEAAQYHGRNLAKRYGVIVIAINYRLGPIGWFSHPALRNGALTPLDASGNFGTLDIIRALEWVQDNIAGFGGDANNVTLYGESAGASDTLSLMASPLAEGLFHRAIVQSGGLGWSTRTRGENYIEEGGSTISGREIVNRLLIDDGTADDREAAISVQNTMSDEELQAYLYSKTAAEIFLVYDDAFAGMLGMPALFRDGVVLPDAEPLSVFESGNYHQVPTILGTNRDENKLFMLMNPEYSETMLLGLLPINTDMNYYNLAARYSADLWKVRGVDEIAAAMFPHQPDSVFAYRFDWDEQPNVFGFNLAELLGAAHGLEITFAFNSPDDFIIPQLSILANTNGNRPGRIYLAENMSSYWTAFARDGDPGTGFDADLDVAWTPWDNDPQGDKMIILDTLADEGIRMSDHTITREGLQAELQAETAFDTLEQKCFVYRSTFGEDEYYLAECL